MSDLRERIAEMKGNFHDSDRGRQRSGGVSDWGRCRKCKVHERLKFTTHRGELVRLPLSCGHEPELREYEVTETVVRTCRDCPAEVTGQKQRCDACRDELKRAASREYHRRVQKGRRAAERTLGV